MTDEATLRGGNSSAGGLDHYRHSDWLGSARLTSSPSQAYLSSVAYAPFGETYAQSGSADLSFTGQNSDTVSGDYDFLFREYSMQGRWASPDPAGLAAVEPANPQSWNRYAYVMNNPTDLIDPTGLHWECVKVKVGDYESETCTWVTDAEPIPDDFYCPLGWHFVVGQFGFARCIPGHQAGDYVREPRDRDRGNSVGDFFSNIWKYLKSVPRAGGIFIPIPYTAGTVSVMVPLAYIPSSHTNCVGLGLAATTPTGKFVSGGPLLIGNLNNAKSILSGWGYNFGAQASPALGVQAVVNSSGALGGPTLATGTGLSAGYGYTVCR